MSNTTDKYYWGMDISLSNTGITIMNDSFNPIHIASIKTTDKNTRGQRLWIIGQEFLKLKELYEPKIIVVEDRFSRFRRETQALDNVHGVMRYLFKDIEPISYAPNTIKQIVTGHGHAKKELVKNVVLYNYPNVKFKNNDESDSMAILCCYLIKENLIKWIKRTA